MKEKCDYSAKEIAIFEGVVDLLRKGQSLHDLKVADIASAAGMGKGTAYEYFSSKEDIISAAITYHVCHEFEEFTEFINGQEDFLVMIKRCIEYVIDMLQNRFSSLLLMFLNLNYAEMERINSQSPDLLASVEVGIHRMSQAIYEMGRSEGLISQEISVDESRLLLVGMISAFSNEARFMLSRNSDGALNLGLPQLPEDPEARQLLQTEITALKDRTINLILRALQ